MPQQQSLLPLVAGTAIIALLVGGVGGYYVGMKRAQETATVQATQNPYADVESNPLSEVKTNPYSDVKVNPFE